jgi:hypothetical protein
VYVPLVDWLESSNEQRLHSERSLWGLVVQIRLGTKEERFITGWMDSLRGTSQ